MSNPQVVTTEQLDALIRDFGLGTRSLSDDVRTRIRESIEAEDELAELAITGPATTEISVFAEAFGWSVWDGEDRVASHGRWLDAYAEALRRGDPHPAITPNEHAPSVGDHPQGND